MREFDFLLPPPTVFIGQMDCSVEETDFSPKGIAQLSGKKGSSVVFWSFEKRDFELLDVICMTHSVQCRALKSVRGCFELRVRWG
jgi:hypothetical protein